MTTPAAAISSGLGAGEATDLAEVTALSVESQAAWADAQTKESTLRMSGVREVSISGFARFFDRIRKRNLRMRTASVEKTQPSSNVYDRRVLMTTSYDDAILSDIDDGSLSARDAFADGKQEIQNATGRKIDQVILFHMHSVVLETGERNETYNGPDGDRNVQTFLTNLTKKYRLNLFHKGLGDGTGGTTKNEILAFSSDDIALIKKIFRKRLIREEIVIALLPEIDHALRTDAEFVASERVFNPSDQVDSGAYVGFRYRGVRMLPILEDVLPAVTANYLGGRDTTARTDAAAIAAAGAYSANTVIVKDLSADTSATGYAAQESTTQPVIALNAGGTAVSSASWAGADIAANGGNTVDAIQVINQADIEQHIIHAWVPRSMVFASRAARVMSKMSERTDLSHASQYYYRTDFGALNIDSKYVLGLLTKGTAVRGGLA